MRNRFFNIFVVTSLCLVVGCFERPDASPGVESRPGAAARPAMDKGEEQNSTARDEDSPSNTDADPVTSSDCSALDEEIYGRLALEADLNGDGRLDLLRANRQRCYGSGCAVTVLAACEGGGYEAVAHLVYFTPAAPITRGEDTINGWYPLHADRATRDEEGLWVTRPVVFVWNGETYEAADE
jgi:hypothetical protein